MNENESYEGENFDDYEEMQNMENEMQSFSGNTKIFNKNLRNGSKRGFEQFTKAKGRATVAITVQNLSTEDKIFELFNTNNSIAYQSDDALYAGQAKQVKTTVPTATAWRPFDVTYTAGLSDPNLASTVQDSLPPVVAFDDRGNLLYINGNKAGSGVLLNRTLLAEALRNFGGSQAQVADLKISMKSTLNGNSYKRFVEKLKTSVILIDQISIVTSNELQFQTSLAQKDYAMLSTGGDDEIQLSDYIRSTQQNPKAIEIYDKKVLVDGDTRLSGIALAGTTTTYTFSLMVINEITKQVYR